MINSFWMSMGQDRSTGAGKVWFDSHHQHCLFGVPAASREGHTAGKGDLCWYGDKWDQDPHSRRYCGSGWGLCSLLSWQVPQAPHRPPTPTTPSCFVPITSINLWPCSFWNMVQLQRLLGISSYLRYPVQSLNQGYFILQFLYIKHHRLLIQTAKLQKYDQEPARVHFLHTLSV